MPNRRDLKLNNFGISKKRYKELSGFCEQYQEWLDELMYKKDTLKSKQITELVQPCVGKSTEDLAIKREELRRKCELIEQTAVEASGELYEYIIKSVCYESPFWYLRDVLGMPTNRTDFTAARRYFFYLLSKNKKM